MGRPVTHFEINGTNAKALGEFYAKAFDWHVDANNPINYGMVDTHAGSGINGGIAQSDDPDMRGVTFYVDVDDLKGALDRIEALGGKTVTPPTEIPGVVTFALFRDPEGNLIGLSKQPS